MVLHSRYSDHELFLVPKIPIETRTYLKIKSWFPTSISYK